MKKAAKKKSPRKKGKAHKRSAMPVMRDDAEDSPPEPVVKDLAEVMTLRVERMSLADIQDHPRNQEIRNHPEPDSQEWETLRASLAYDYFDPLVVNIRNGQLVSGHLRKKLMLAEGVKEADVVVKDYDEPTHMARMLAANKTVGAQINQGVEAWFKEFETVGGDFDPAIAGFTFDERAGFMDEEPGFQFPGQGATGATGTTDGNNAQNDQGADGDKGSSGGNDPTNSSIRYTQLIYTLAQHEEFIGLVDQVKANYGQQITEAHGEDTLPAVVLWCVGQLAAAGDEEETESAEEITSGDLGDSADSYDSAHG